MPTPVRRCRNKCRIYRHMGHIMFTSPRRIFSPRSVSSLARHCIETYWHCYWSNVMHMLIALVLIISRHCQIHTFGLPSDKPLNALRSYFVSSFVISRPRYYWLQPHYWCYDSHDLAITAIFSHSIYIAFFHFLFLIFRLFRRYFAPRFSAAIPRHASADHFPDDNIRATSMPPHDIYDV